MSLSIFRDHDGHRDDLSRSENLSSHSPSASVKDDMTSAPATPAPATRSLGPDLVRVVAAGLVVYLHAGVAYLNHPMPGLVWATIDSPSTLVSQLFWSIELFIMPLFLLLAGFFAYRSWIASGDFALIRSRARRLLVPMSAAAIVLLPINYLIWLVGWVIDGSVPADHLWSLKFPRDLREHLFGFAHLWFLLYVFLYCVVLAGLGVLRRQVCATPANDVPSGGGLGKSSPAMFVSACALPLVGTCVLLWAPEVVFGFQHAFLPVASKWLYSGTFFFGGAVLAAWDPRMSLTTTATTRLSGVGAVCGFAAILLGQWAIERADSTSLAMDIGLVARVSLASLTVVSAWAISLAMIGLGNLASPFVMQRPRVRRVIAYLAAASFWIYLVHHPLVALLQIDLKLLLPTFSPLAKSLFVTAGAVGIAVASYEVLIRERLLGRLLGLDGSVQTATAPDRVKPQIDAQASESGPVVVTPPRSIQAQSVRRAA